MRILIFAITVLSGVLSLGAAAASGDYSPLLMLDTGGHQGQIKNIAVTQDGKKLISASQDKTIRVWDFETGTPIRTIFGQAGHGEEGQIFAMAFSPDGRTVAVGGIMGPAGNSEQIGAIRLFDIESGRLMSVLSGHAAPVNSLAFSSNGKSLISGAGTGKAEGGGVAIIWDVTTRQQLHQLSQSGAPIDAVAFTLDDARAVTSSVEGAVQLWNVADGTLIKVITEKEQKVTAIAVSPVGQVLATGSESGEIKLWDANNGSPIRILGNQGTEVSALSFNPDGRELLSGFGNTGIKICHVWNVESGAEIAAYRGHDGDVVAVAFTPDGNFAVTAGGNNNEIHAWDWHTGQTAKTFKGFSTSIFSVGFSSDNREIAWGTVDPCPASASCPEIQGALEYRLALPSKRIPLGEPQAIVKTAAEKDYLRARFAQGPWSLRRKKPLPPASVMCSRLLKMTRS
ncbi:MAG: WD40 repeat domain-containing protein [Rhodomicrobium sp.]